MSGKKGRKAEKGKGVNWDLLWKVLASIFAFAGSLATVYDLIGKIRADVQTFTNLIVPGLVIIVWLIILIQLVRKRNPYVMPLLAITVLGGVIGGLGWQSYNKTQEDKVVVLVAQFDGPEENYGLHDQIMEDLRQATKGYTDTEIIDGKEVVTAGQGSEYANELGKEVKADLVIWAWYRPIENPNITIHIENLSASEVVDIKESEIYQPDATLAQLRSFEIQRQLGSETTSLVTFLTGMLRYKAEDYQTAIDRFEQALKRYDNSSLVNQSNLLFSLGTSYLAPGNYNSAISYFDKVIEITPQAAEAFINRSTAYYGLRDYQRAAQDLDKAIEIDPQSSMAYSNRGNIHRILEEFDHAIQDYDRAIELNPVYSVAYFGRGVVYAALEKNNLAIKDYQKAIEINPRYTDAYYNRGVVYSSIGKYNHAIQDFDTVLKIDPKFERAYGERGNVYYFLANYKRALRDFEQAIKIDPANPSGYYNRGLTYQKLGKISEAEADFKKYEELTGKKP